MNSCQSSQARKRTSTRAASSTGVLLCHGFTGSPGSLRPWAEYLAEAGLTVSVPRLPGHGTTWQEMSRTRWEDWYAEADRAYRGTARAEQRDLRDGPVHGGLPGAADGGTARRRGKRPGPGQPVGGPDTKLFLLAPALKLVVPSLPGIASDIKKEGVTELGYTRVPVRAAASLPALWRLTQSQLGEVTQPVLVYRSTVDHVVGPASMRVLRAGAAPGPADRS